ncbi:iron-containing alcohol dehydrogenase PsrA [Xylophilus sp. GW821-FHT01B05]
MWNYYNPVAVHAGLGSLAELPRLLGQRRAILIAFPEAESLGLLARLRTMLGDRLLAIETDVRPNPDVAWLAPMYERLWRDRPDAECVIAVGGGSTLDCAKAMLTHTPGGRFDDLMSALESGGVPQAGGAHRRLLAVPTTAGTGSEVTPWATVWDHARSRKLSLHLPWTWPEAAIVDAELMLSLPHATTLAAGLDALSHALESLWNVHRNPVSSCLAVQAARNIIDTLPALLGNLERADLRHSLAIAALQAGLAFSNTRTALAHSLSYDVTLSHGTVHGIACSFSLPRIMALAAGRDAQLDRQLMSVFGVPDMPAAITAMAAFLQRLSVSTDPTHYGIPEPEWDKRIDAALQGPRGRNFIATA